MTDYGVAQLLGHCPKEVIEIIGVTYTSHDKINVPRGAQGKIITNCKNEAEASLPKKTLSENRLV